MSIAVHLSITIMVLINQSDLSSDNRWVLIFCIPNIDHRKLQRFPFRFHIVQHATADKPRLLDLYLLARLIYTCLIFLSTSAVSQKSRSTFDRLY